MRAAVMDHVGGPEVLRVESIPTPTPGPGEVLLKVAACGVCGHDQADRLGLMKIPLPATLGHEFAGTVVSAAPESRFQPSDRVAARQYATCGHCASCKADLDLYCPDRAFLYGGFADFVVVKESCLIPVPDSVSFEQASIVGCAISTVLQALREVAKVQPGESVLVTGASGGLGLHALQIIRALGAVPFAATTSAAKGAALLGAGAEGVVVTSEPNFADQIVDVTEGRGMDVLLDNVGSPSVFGGFMKSMAPRGRIVFTGQLAREKVAFYPRFLFAKELVVTGSAGTTMSTFVDAMSMVERGDIRPVVTSYPLERIREAFDDLDNRRTVGRAVVTP